MLHHRDLIVVGGSFAGLACGQSAAEHGASVVLLDAKPDPGIRIHTTGLLVQEAMDIWDPPNRCVRPIEGVRLYAPNLRSVDLHRPGYAFWSTDTAALMRWAAKQAAARGVQIQHGCRYRNATHHRNRVVLADHPWAGRFLIGADGARSRVARTCGLETNRQFLVGLEIELKNVRGVDPNLLHVFLDGQLAPGYIAWAFEGVGRTQIGLAVRPPAHPRLEPLMEKLSKQFDFSRAQVIDRRGGQIPIGGPLRHTATEKIMLLGDAAGSVSPLTAGGIHTAIQGGRLAGQAVAQWLQGCGEHPAQRVRQVLPTYRCKRVMRSLMDVGLPDALLNFAMRAGPLRALAQVVFYHHRGLMSAAAWRDAALALVTGRA